MTLLKWFAVMLLLAIPLITLWYYIVYLLVRPFGLHLSLHWPTRSGREESLIERAALTRLQYVIVYGVLGWGVGVALLLNASDYLAFRLGIHSAITMTNIVGNFVMFPLGGIFFGYLTWNQRHG